jgi:hypothetical protein
LHPQVLSDYLWLLMLNEHFIDYQTCVRDQVEQQLRYVPVPSVSSEPSEPSEPLSPAPQVATPVRSV